MTRKVVRLPFPVAALSVGVWLHPACGLEPPLTSRSAPVRSVTPTPKSWETEDVVAAFVKPASMRALVSFPVNTDWWKLEGKAPTESKARREQAWQPVLMKQNRLECFLQIDPYTSRRGPIPNLPRAKADATFADPDLRAAYLADVENNVRLFQPKYVCLAMEINAYHEQHPEDFDNFVSLFKEARRAVRQILPEAKVFVSFQYEQLLGHWGGQGDRPRHAPKWELIGRFEPDADAVGISSYPLEQFSPPRYGDPAKLPADYYARIKEHTSKPIVFTELGWPSDAKFGGSPQNQARFLERFPELVRDLNVLLVNWNFLHDAKGFGDVFESMGLIDAQGRPKPALAVFEGLWR